MSIKALSWAWDYETKDALEKLVLLCVADHVNDSMGNQAWPSVERISSMCGCSRSTTLRKLKQLEEKGVIQRQKRFNKTDIVVFTYNAPEGWCQSGRCHTDTSNDAPEVSQRHTNPYNNLTLTTSSEKNYKRKFHNGERKKKELTEKQKAFAHTLAERLFNAHKHEGFAFAPILHDVEIFLKSSQTVDDWKSIGNGLPFPLGS